MAETDATINGVKVQLYEGKADASRRSEGVVLVAADGSPINGASGKAEVANVFTASGYSAAFTPIPGRPFNFRLWGTFVASIYIDSSADGAVWIEETDFGVTVALVAPCKVPLIEYENGIQYRARCVFSSGSASYSFRQ